MSGSWTVSNLEEVFLSDEFARSGGSGGQVEFTDGHSGHAPPVGQPHQHHRSDEGPEESRLDMTHKPLATVLAFAPGTPAGRQRAIAAMGGVAATVLVVVGLTSGGPQGPGSGQRSEALARAGHHGNPLLPPADTPPSRVRVPTGAPGVLAADHTRSAASGSDAAAGVRGSFSIFNGAATGGPSSSGASGLPSGGTSVAPSLPSAPSTSASNPVTQLTSNVGSELSTTTQQISAILPAAVPITGVVNNVTGAVSGLSGTLATPNT